MSLKINIQKDSGTNAVTKSVVVGSGKAITPSGTGIIEATNLLGNIDASQVSTGTLDPARLPLGLGTDTAPANGKLLIGNGAGYTAANLSAGTNISITNTAGGITINNTMPSGLIYQGAWDAATNTPPLASSVGTQGYYYVVSVAGTTNLNGVTDWQIGDWAIFNGTIWQKIDNTDAVTSVFGRQGAVVAANGDYTASQVTNVPYAGIISTTVQSAINELYDDIQATEQALTAYVTNAESFSITRGQVVYLYGASGDRASVKLASNLSDATSAKTFGVVADASIAAGQAGYIRCQGVVGNLNLGAYNPGDTLYLGATPGSVTATKPYAPNHLVYVGIVERANNGNGLLYVRIQNGYELDEIHDVQITAPVLAGSTLLYDATTSLWKNARLTAGTGMTITNADASVTLTPNFAAPPVIGNTTPNIVNATTLNATDVAATNGTFTNNVTTPYVKAGTGVYLTLGGGDTGATLVLGLGANGQATFDRKLSLVASTTTAASLNIPQGTAPTSPTNGDIWTTSTGLYARINGTTVGPLGSAPVTSVSGTANQVTVSPTTGDVVVSLPPQLIISGQSLTGSSATSLLDLSTTWNTTGNPTALKLNVTNTASGSTSNLLDLQVGGTSQFNVTKAGNVTVSGTGTSSVAGKLLLGTTTDSNNGKLQLATHTTNVGGIGFGSDISLFKTQAQILRFDGSGAGATVFRIASLQATNSGIEMWNSGGLKGACYYDASSDSVKLYRGSDFLSGTSSTVSILPTTATTSTTTGALVVSGGAGIAGAVYAGADSYFNGVRVGLGNSAVSGNTVVGAGALNAITTGNYNIGIGLYAGSSLTTGANNIFVGYNAGIGMTSGSQNVIVGVPSPVNGNSSYNTMIGYGTSNGLTGNENTSVGRNSTAALTSGQYNTAIGSQAGFNITSGSNNLYLGYFAGRYSTTQSGEIFVDNRDRSNRAGDLAGALLYGVTNATPASQTLTINAATTVSSTTASTSTTSGALQVAGGLGAAGSGYFGGNRVQVGYGNQADNQLRVGQNDASYNSIVFYHSYVGYGSSSNSGSIWMPSVPNVFLRFKGDGTTVAENTTDSTSTTTGSLVTSGGLGVAKAMYVGSDSYINGVRVGQGTNVNQNNVAVGTNSPLRSLTTGYSNTALGNDTLAFTTSGASNVAIGSEPLKYCRTASNNIGIGYRALHISGDTNSLGNNVGIGSEAGRYLGAGNSTFVGHQSGFTTTSGSTNSAFGYQSLYSNSTGSNNVAIGSNAGRYETGSNSFYVDALDRSNTAGDKAGALLYGTFNATPASQTLTINAATTVSSTTASTSTSTGSLIVGGGLGVAGAGYFGTRIGIGVSSATANIESLAPIDGTPVTRFAQSNVPTQRYWDVKWVSSNTFTGLQNTCYSNGTTSYGLAQNFDGNVFIGDASSLGSASALLGLFTVWWGGGGINSTYQRGINIIDSAAERLAIKVTASNDPLVTNANSVQMLHLGGVGDLALLSRGSNVSNIRFYTSAGSNVAEVGRFTSNSKFLLSPQAYSQSAWTTTGALTTHGAATVTDSSTAASGTAATAVFHSWATPTLSATNTSVTTTDAATLYVAGGPTAGTNQTLTNSWGLWNVGKTRLDGAVTAKSSVLSTSATGGIGYATGAGGAVTQATSRTTGVTLNTVSGAITLASEAGSTTWQTFTVTNSAVAATDVVQVSQKSGTDIYQIAVSNVSAGSFKISLATTGGTTTEQPVINFAVIKAVTS